MNRRQRSPKTVLILVLTLTSFLMNSCRDDLLFKNDHRINILNPQHNSEVKEPLTVEWTAEDFNPGDDGQFAVFLDRDPMPPGEDIEFFSLLQRTENVYFLTDYSLQIEILRPRTNVGASERDHHDITVILLDQDGKRISESTGYVEFKVLTE